MRSVPRPRAPLFLMPPGNGGAEQLFCMEKRGVMAAKVPSRVFVCLPVCAYIKHLPSQLNTRNNADIWCIMKHISRGRQDPGTRTIVHFSCVRSPRRLKWSRFVITTHWRLSGYKLVIRFSDGGISGIAPLSISLGAVPFYFYTFASCYGGTSQASFLSSSSTVT